MFYLKYVKQKKDLQGRFTAQVFRKDPLREMIHQNVSNAGDA